MVAPMSLSSYEEVRPWAKAMVSAVSDKEMPPWSAESVVPNILRDMILVAKLEKMAPAPLALTRCEASAVE
jgi:hypothetical protein